MLTTHALATSLLSAPIDGTGLKLNKYRVVHDDREAELELNPAFKKVDNYV